MKQKSKMSGLKRRVLSGLLVFAMLLTMIPVGNLGKVEVKAKTLYADKIMKYLSEHENTIPKNAKGNSFANLCLSWCKYVYSNEFGVDASMMGHCAPCAMNTLPANGITVSTDRTNIPIGAFVYFGGPSKQDRCKTTGKPLGHTVLYAGNGKVAGVRGSGVLSLKETIATWESWGYPFLGWALPAGVTIEGGGIAIENVTSPSSITVSNPVYPTGNLSLGQSFGIRGTINSIYNLINVTGTISDGTGKVYCQKSLNPNKTSYDLKKEINNAMTFNTLPTGSYHFVVSATDSKGFTKPNVIDTWFSVGSIPQPTISTSGYVGGLTIQMSTSLGAIYYTLDGSEPTASSRRYTGPISVNGNTTVKAVSIEGGSKSNTTTQYIAVPVLSTPSINSYTGTNDITVNITADAGASIHYTLDGSEPTTSSPQYYGAIQLTDTKTVKAKAFRSGSMDSATASATISVKEPETPKLSVTGSDKIAAGDAVKVSWDKEVLAYSYTVKLYKGSKVIEEQTTQGNTCAFTLPEAGEYTITVTAKNFKGSSSESYPPVTVSAMAPSTVIFRDFDETVISTQQVKYGYYAELPAENPSRRGYDFSRWDTNAIYQPVTGDVTATAQYTKKKYVVKFVDEGGKTLSPQQEVLFDESVTLPADPTTDKIGYAFMGWRCISSDESSALDYEHVDANMTLQAVFDWGNKDFPVVSNITKALQVDSNSYKVSVNFTAWPESKVYARAIISLKTSEGKMTKTVVQDITLEPDQTTSLEDFELISDKVATQVEVNVVGLEGQKTGGAYAEAAIAKTTSYTNTMWSEWSTTPPPAGVQSESKEQYRYREKIFTQSTAGYLAGWTQYNTPTTTYGGWSGTMGTTVYPGTSDTLQITGSSTTYHYHHVCGNKYDGKSNVDSIAWGSAPHRWHYLDMNYPLPTLNIADKGNQQAYGGVGKASPCVNNWYAWFLDGWDTTWYYQTRSKTVTYYYYQWGPWSSYSDTSVAWNVNREIESRTVYRYLINLETPTEGEDNSGEVYTQEGALTETDIDLNGKRANVLVYRSTNTDPTENQLEYVGQTTFGEGNTYSFTFKPMESPDEANSNFIVALSIEGQTNLYNIDVLYKTKNTYNVSFYDKEGELIETCEVAEGDSAGVPDAPEVEGYTFIGWDKDTTNVQADRAITAMYKAKEYSVVYVDWENNFIQMCQLPYGAELPEVETEPIEGKKFLGWDALLEGKTTVDGHMLIEATYDVEEFTVQFVDAEDNVISEQDVAYGNAAILPKSIDAGDKKFLGWSNTEKWWYVTKDIVVKPILAYEETANIPMYHVEDTYIGGILTLEAADAETIYYAVEPKGTEEETEGEPENAETITNEIEWNIYEDEIVLHEDATVSFYAESAEKNDSTIASVDYTYTEVENPYIKSADITIPTVAAKAGGSIEIPVQIGNNPGFMGTVMEISYDASAFSEVSVEVGNVFDASGAFYENIFEEDGMIQILWYDVENTYETGTMFTLHMTAKEGIADGKYPLNITYYQEDTFNDNWDDVKFNIPESAVNIGEVSYGDANVDGKINNKDVAYIASYLVGKVTLTQTGLAAADVNRDDRVDNKDVAKLARYLVGKEATIGVK